MLHENRITRPSVPRKIEVRRANWIPWILTCVTAATAWLALTAYAQSPASPSPSATGGGAASTNFLVLLAPFIALATAIERFWEAVFDFYEKLALSAARLVGVGAQGMAWVKTEMDNAEQAVAAMATQLGAKTPQDADYKQLWTAFQEAEKRLQDAQARIADTVKSPGYVAFKRAITVVGSLVLGLVISVLSWERLCLFNAAGFTIDRGVDSLLTGLLIGSGPGPQHSFIGMLQEFRNTLASLADLTRGTAIKKAVEALQPAAPNVPPAAPSLPAASAPPGTPVSQPVSQPLTDSTASDAPALRRQAQRVLR